MKLQFLKGLLIEYKPVEKYTCEMDQRFRNIFHLTPNFIVYTDIYNIISN